MREKEPHVNRPFDLLILTDEQRARAWRLVLDTVEEHLALVGKRHVFPSDNYRRLNEALATYDFSSASNPEEVLRFVMEGLARWQVHTTHPRYFGLFNPNSTSMGILADAIVAAYNPQLATFSHSPLAASIERHVVRHLGAKLGYAGELDGTFTSGGSEANHTAVLTALVHQFPEFGHVGVRGLSGDPVLYVSSEAHHSFHKIARMCGLGNAVREVGIDSELRMDLADLARQVAGDRAAGRLPFMVVATAGTTAGGIIDPVRKIVAFARAERLWCHVDAAWGGAAALVPHLAPVLEGTGEADSITFDAHKWLSVPMGAGLYLTRHREILTRTFDTQASYMPNPMADPDQVDPYRHTIQWSRRFIGLKVFLSLAVAGWEGYRQALEHQVRMGDVLRELLAAHGWRIKNATPLPLVCFDDPRLEPNHLKAIVNNIVSSGKAWISNARLGTDMVIRACITNYRTQEADVKALVDELERLRHSRA
jgi:glutamate/tyrosine decarboxylase-like PLP-dependent enzyme